MTLSKEEIDSLREKSKDDKAIIVGSEVRQLCDQALLAIDLEDAFRLIQSMAGHPDPAEACRKIISLINEL